MHHSPTNSRTWSRHVKNLIKMYSIENLSFNLEKTPPPKSKFKSSILIKITQFWESKLRKDAQNNSKMKYFNVSLIGLTGRCHPALCNITTTQQVIRMRPHLKMLCGDYYTYELRAKYQGGSPQCRLCTSESQNIENIEHILITCPNYSDVRQRVISEMKTIVEGIDYIQTSENIFSDNHNMTQFILNCTSANLTTRINYNDENLSKIFELSRGLCYSIHKTRISLLKDIGKKT